MTTSYPLDPKQHFGIGVTTGLVPGAKFDNVSHTKSAIPSLTEVVCENGVNTTLADYPFLDEAGEDIEVLSSEIGDTATIEVSGLDAAGNPKIENIQLTGSTPVVSSGWRRVNYSVTNGAEPHTGTVTIRRASDAAVLLQQAVSAQRGFNGVYAVRADYTASIFGLIAALSKDGGSNTAVTLRIYTRLPGQNFFRLDFAAPLQRDGDGSPDFSNPFPDRLPPLTDVAFTVESETAGTAVFVRASWLLLATAQYPMIETN